MSPEAVPREALFYHLERSGVEDALPELLEKTLERGKRALVLSGDPALLDRLDDRLWSWRPESFLAHGRGGTPDAARQPILLTGGGKRERRRVPVRARWTAGAAGTLRALCDPVLERRRGGCCPLPNLVEGLQGRGCDRSLPSANGRWPVDQARLRAWTVLPILAALAACAEPPPRASAPSLPPPPDLSAAPIAEPPPAIPRPASSQCGLEELQGLIGRPTSEIPVPVYPLRRRVVCSTCPMTQDYSPSRQTILFDAATGRVTEVKCG